MLGNKGQLMFLGILAAAASLFVAVAMAAGEIQTLLAFMMKNAWWIITLFIVLTVGSVFVINSYQDNPKWALDFKYILAGIGVIIFLLVLPMVLGGVYGYTADATIKVSNPVFGYSKITSLSVDNFEKSGPLSLLAGPSLSLYDDLQGEVITTCDGEEVDKDTFGMTIPEGGISKKVVKLNSLPSGSDCSVMVNIIQDNSIVDTRTQNLKIPGE